MGNIAIGDLSGKADIQIDDASLLSQANLTSLVSKTEDLIADLSKPLGDAKFNSASFTARYGTPKISLDSSRTLSISTSIEPWLKLYRFSDSPLLGKDDFTPAIEIAPGQFWLGFQLGATVDVTPAAALPNGFGVSVDGTKQASFAIYQMFDSAAVLRDAIADTLSEFEAGASAVRVRAQKPRTVLVSDIGGVVKVSGSWSIPGSVNAYALADMPGPITIEVQGASCVTLTGSIAISGDFVFRSWKQDDDTLLIGLFKKKGTTFSASFLASEGLEAGPGSVDLIPKFFALITPGVDTSVLGPGADAIRDTLKDSVNRSLSILLNACCSAALSDESAFVYSIDLSANQAATDAAVNAAIAGDWTKIAKLPNATEKKNAIGRVVDSKQKIVVNLLGIYNYASVSDFIRDCTVVHCVEDGSVTITDKQTAQRVAVGSMPHQAKADQLRKVLSEAAITTAAYSFAKAGNVSSVTASQALVIYEDSMDAAALQKAMLPAYVLDVVTKEQITAAVSPGVHRHVLIHIEQKIDDAAARRIFLDPSTGQPWQEASLRAIGIGQLRNFLDANDSADLRRLEFLAHWPEDPPPAPYSVDWLDITWWAESVAAAAVKYLAAREAFDRIPPGADASKDTDFMRARGELASALAGMSNKEHSGFTPGWPLAVMYRIARGNSARSLNASWDGAAQFQLPAAKSVTAEPVRPA